MIGARPIRYSAGHKADPGRAPGCLAVVTVVAHEEVMARGHREDVGVVGKAVGVDVQHVMRPAFGPGFGRRQRFGEAAADRGRPHPRGRSRSADTGPSGPAARTPPRETPFGTCGTSFPFRNRMPFFTCTVSPGRPIRRLMKSDPLTGWRNTTTSPRSGSARDAPRDRAGGQRGRRSGNSHRPSCSRTGNRRPAACPLSRRES